MTTSKLALSQNGTGWLIGPLFCKFQVHCEKLVVEKEDVVTGLVELIVLHRVTKLIISAAADRQYSR